MLVLCNYFLDDIFFVSWCESELCGDGNNR